MEIRVNNQSINKKGSFTTIYIVIVNDLTFPIKKINNILKKNCECKNCEL